VFVP
jgi:hypothetical protein